PVVVAVEGICYTVGLELILAADIAVAGEGSQFSQIEVQRAICAYGGATIRMVERAGWGNAMSVLLTGDVFSAQRAKEFGFIQWITPDGEAFEKALDIAKRIAQASPLAIKETLKNARTA